MKQFEPQYKTITPKGKTRQIEKQNMEQISTKNMKLNHLKDYSETSTQADCQKAYHV